MARASPFTTCSSIAQDLTSRLSASEEKLFARTQSRLRTYFSDFHELEGFAVLGASLDCLFSKVSLEVRALFHEFHGSLQAIEDLTSATKTLKEELDRQQALCDQVAREAQSLMKRFARLQNRHKLQIEELHEFYGAQEKLLQKKWRIDAETRHRLELQALVHEQIQRTELASIENPQRVVKIKKQLEVKKQAELEYTRVQLHLQMRAQMEREGASLLDGYKAECASYKQKMKAMQRQIWRFEEHSQAKKIYESV